MSQPVQLALSGASHSNSRLFSDYYLDNLLPAQWGGLQDEAAQVMAQLQRLQRGYTPNASNEAQTEDDWIKPVLHALGHLFEVQVPLKVPDGTKRPDYIFYRDVEAMVANKNRGSVQAEDLRAAYAVGDAKAWGRSLDQALRDGNTSADPFTNKNPSYQIFFYMLHSGLPWGILTNGQQWRLYQAQSAHKLEVYYEVNLPTLLEANDPQAFLYFYAFFRRAAFEPGPLSLDSILAASAEKAREISEQLREQVYDALRFVAQGFLDYKANGLQPSTETNKQIYDNSLILLYRLLFILYAEARNLLPVQDNTGYRRRYSLEAIKKEVVTLLGESLILTNSGSLWARLKDLFAIINEGSPPLTVTTFNGGLFDAQRHPFLEHYTVGDLSLCRAIDKLARVDAQFVDYRDLAERHLGTIYEGLLEYSLHVADEPMVELRGSSKIVPASGVPEKQVVKRFAAGEVYLATDRGERKLTGSYYTPDFIVKYMVDETVKPVLDAAIAGKQSDAERVPAILSINVLDPSMGSGHFPVEVTEYIARYLVELGAQPDELEGQTRQAGTLSEMREGDLTYWKRRVAQQCIYGIDLNPLAVELAKLSLWLITAAKDRPLSFLDHHLRSGNALIGSWLEDIAAGQDPKTRQKRMRQLREEQQGYQEGDGDQLRFELFDEHFRATAREALGAIATIERNPGATIKDVKAQEEAYEALRQHFSQHYLYLAHLGTALLYSDLPIEKETWPPLADYALGRSIEQSQQFVDWLDAACALAEAKSFFHWELEFPNIFFDEQGQPLDERAGFDVVIGNPPYVRQEKLGPDKPFYQERYGDVYHGVADLFVYFFAQGLRLLRQDGRLAYISSNMWLRTNYATPLRRYLRTQTTVETIVDLGNTRVFADAPDLSPSIQIVHKTLPADTYIAQVAIFGRGESIKSFREQLADKSFAVSIQDQPDTGWQLASDTLRELFTKIMAKGKPLGEIADGKMYRGVLTGLNEAFIIDQATRDRLIKFDPTCASLIKPMLRGEDLRPWYQENEGRWLICLPNGWTMQTFPNIEPSEAQAWEKLSALHPGLADYLYHFADAARKRLDKGQFWWELRPCDYYEAFDKPKIFWPDIARFPRFSWDEERQYINNKGYILPVSDKALLGILQSRISWFCITRLCAPLGERVGLMIYQHFTQFMVNLPIPTLNDDQRAHIGGLAQQLTETARQRYEVRRRTTHRIARDLGAPGAESVKLNQRLQEWWLLPFSEFREEARKVFKRDIPLKERDDWEELLRERAGEIRRLTDEIIRLETELNAAVYDVFGLDESERKLIEQETKYRYGEW